MTNILITKFTGFIELNFIPYFLDKIVNTYKNKTSKLENELNCLTENLKSEILKTIEWYFRKT